MNDQNHTPHPAVVAELFSSLEHELQQHEFAVEFRPLAGVRRMLARQRGGEANTLQADSLAESRTALRPATSTE